MVVITCPAAARTSVSTAWRTGSGRLAQVPTAAASSASPPAGASDPV
jgi:hypothetical protein